MYKISQLHIWFIRTMWVRFDLIRLTLNGDISKQLLNRHQIFDSDIAQLWLVQRNMWHVSYLLVTPRKGSEKNLPKSVMWANNFFSKFGRKYQDHIRHNFTQSDAKVRKEVSGPLNPIVPLLKNTGTGFHIDVWFFWRFWNITAVFNSWQTDSDDDEGGVSFVSCFLG